LITRIIFGDEYRIGQFSTNRNAMDYVYQSQMCQGKNICYLLLSYSETNHNFE
jgi:hypothetical protein